MYTAQDQTATQKIQRKDSFVDSVVKTRNYYTHFGEHPHVHILKGRELQRMNKKLEIFFSVILLREIGIQSSIIDEAVKYQSEIRFSDLRAE